MKERFLPFTSKDADLKTLKQKLWQGGQGVPTKVLISMLLAIKIHGLLEVRKRLSSFSDCNTWLEAYEKLISLDSAVDIDAKVAENLKALQNLVVDEDVYLNFLEYYTDSSSDFSYFAALKDENLAIPEGIFSDSGEPLEISSEAEIIAFIIYATHINKSLSLPKKLVLKRSKNGSP